jgi:CheY-like chemotaxis protein
MTVLYAEDDLDDLEIFLEVTRSVNPQVDCIHVQNGHVALDFLEQASVLPDIIFLDINMPAMDDKSFLKILKKDERLKAIPVVVYSTCHDSREKEQCLQLGAIDFMEKPNRMGELFEKLSKYLQKEEN